MSVRRLFLFFALVALCLTATSINQHQSINKKFEEFQKLEQKGQQERAEPGYRCLAMKFPYTTAGLKSAGKLVEGGASGVGLSLQILKAGVENATMSEWLVLVSAFLVTVVFIGNNALPSIIFFPFVISAAGMFHLSHPLVSVDSSPFSAFLAINPYIYIALTLLIAAGYICNRWEFTRQTAYKKAFVDGTLTLGEQLLVRERYLKKLEGLQERADCLENDLKTPHGQHFVSEVKRLCEAMKAERQHVIKLLESVDAQYQEMMKYTQDIIDHCRQERIETEILFKSKAFNRKEYRKKKGAITSTLKKSRRRISEIKAKIAEYKAIHYGSRQQLMRQDVFCTFMNEHFIDEQGLILKIVYKDILSHPQSAENNIKRRKLLYRKSSFVGGKLIKLEQRRSKIKEKVYKEDLASLANEKKILDRELVALAGKISEQMAACKNQQEKLEGFIGALSAERDDLKNLAKIRGCFPGHIKSRALKVGQDIKFCKRAIPRIQKVEKIYKISQRMLLE